MFNIVVGIIWQTALTTVGVFLVIEEFDYMLLSLAVVVVTSIILKLNWLDRMEDYPAIPELSREDASVPKA
jgi:hypothetical protein